MKKIIIGLIIVSILVIFFNTVLAQQYDFRKTNWGMSREEAKITEDGEPTSDNMAFLSYKEVIDRKDCTYTYYFFEDELYKGGYFFSGERNRDSCINDYKELKEILTKEYGKPKADNIVWKDDLWREDNYYHRPDVSIDDLSYGSIWETSTTEIELILLDFDNDKPILMIRYESRGPEDMSANEVEGTDKWICNRKTDPIDDTETISFILTSDSGKSTFGEPIRLVLRHQSGEKSGKTELFISWHNYLSGEYLKTLGRYSSTILVTYRFGDRKAVTDGFWVISTDHTATFRSRDTIRFIQKLMTVNQFIARVTPYNEGPTTAVFDVRELRNAVEQFNETLHWIKD